MASVTRGYPLSRPACSFKYLRPAQKRCLSTSQPHFAIAQAAQGASATRNLPKQKAMSSRMKKLKKSEIPNDIGLIPSTYIRPCGDMPSWFSTPLARVQLEWLYLKQRSLDFMGYIYVNRWNQNKDAITGKRKTLPLKLRDRYTIARDLHTKLYTAIAEGDKKMINKIACAGLANQQVSRIERAHINGSPPETWNVRYRGWVVPSKLYFTIQSLIPSFFKSFHVVADRQIPLPAGPGMTIRQVVLRVDSTQTLDRNDGAGPITKDMREYLVIQKSIVDEEEEDWKVWGTVNPSSAAEAYEIITSTKNETGSMTDRLRAMWPGSLS